MRAIAIQERFIQEIRFTFNKFSARAATLLCLIPSVTCSSKADLDLRSIIAEYKDDLRNWEIADQKIRLWQRKWQTHIEESRASMSSSSLKD